MTKQDLTRQEEFKRATAGALRAVAHANAEVQVAFQPGPGGVSGKRVRLPLPTRTLPAAEMAKLRGAADAAALKIRHHNEGVHASRMPQRRAQATTRRAVSAPLVSLSVSPSSPSPSMLFETYFAT
jgi:cobaltochelatase CobT